MKLSFSQWLTSESSILFNLMVVKTPEYPSPRTVKAPSGDSTLPTIIKINRRAAALSDC